MDVDLKLFWLHPTDLQEAILAQHQMRKHVIEKDDFKPPKWVAGVDVSCNWRDVDQMIYASMVCLSWPDLKVVDISSCAMKQEFPYITGFLGFREVPALLRAYKALTTKPDLLFVDGHGLCHPRGFGIASHLGVILDIPTLGVGKSILVGKPQRDLGDNVGSVEPLLYKDRVVAYLLRSKKRSRPLIISNGHRLSLSTALTFARQALKGYRLPEPTRLAHLEANKCRHKHQ